MIRNYSCPKLPRCHRAYTRRWHWLNTKCENKLKFRFKFTDLVLSFFISIFIQTKKELRRMKCWLKTDNPMLILKPQKIERIWANPEIFMLRGIMEDSYIEKIKEQAYPMVSLFL